MDNLERYLDQVCRTIAGPRALRQHVREELREHLTDAVAQHRAAGLTEEESLKRALDDFGGPEQVRSELEAAHGHRVMGVVIDKAMQWKERTMKGKWFWTTAAHLVLVLLTAGQATLLVMIALFVVPKHLELLRRTVGVSEFRNVGDVAQQSREMLKVLGFLEQNVPWIAIGVFVIWAVFEWRARSESKPFVRLTALAMLALGLTGIVAYTATGLVYPWIMIGPRLSAPPPSAAELAQHRANLESVVKTAQGTLERSDLIVPEDLRAFEYQLSLAVPAAAVLDVSPDLYTAVEQLQRAVYKAYRSDTEEIDTYDRQRLDDALRAFLEAAGKLPGNPATTRATTSHSS